MHYAHVLQNRSPCIIFSVDKCKYYLVDHQVFDNHEVSTIPYRLKFNGFFPTPGFRVIGSANGLLCFASYFYYVCNPITYDLISIEVTTPRIHGNLTVSGFGFDSINDKYKVIEITLCSVDETARCSSCDELEQDCWKAEAEVYTLGSGSMSTEEFCIIQPPSTIVFDEEYTKLVVLEEHLCLVLSFYDRLDIWMMKDHNNQNSWTKKYFLCLDALPVPSLCDGFKFMGLLNGKLLLWHDKQKLGYYEHQTETFTAITVNNNDAIQQRTAIADNYKDVIQQHDCEATQLTNLKPFKRENVSEANNYDENSEVLSIRDNRAICCYQRKFKETSFLAVQFYRSLKRHCVGANIILLCKMAKFCVNEGGEEELQVSGDFPSDVLLDILSRLPLKSLSNFRWVCKTWYNVIHHPRFAMKHYVHALQNRSPCIVITVDKGVDYLVDHQVFDNHQVSTVPYSLELCDSVRLFRYQVISSVNGLICYCDYFLCDPCIHESYYSCNPITQEHILLPEPPKNKNCSIVFSRFGFDSINDKYKVIQILQHSDYKYEAQIYTLGSGRWRKLKSPPSDVLVCPPNVFVNGYLHWLGEDCLENFVILIFSMSTEEFSIIQPPLAINLIYGDQELVVLDEHLCLVRFSRDQLDIWKMKDHGNQNSWTQEYCLSTYGRVRLDLALKG
ncbi:hypothetical protein IFM89_029865 [Coptis chinensis]|uniref:F-box domain-containing protein n=1 Tax=Coptis chinensis TaxID=261450 RepID=A0A835HMW6_9MAGN|nr:hypothetical protein IFM89_029865 [Coptis chinensis]